MNDLKPGSYVLREWEDHDEEGTVHGEKVWLFGFTPDNREGVVMRSGIPLPQQTPFYVGAEELKPWNPDPKPKSFEDGIEKVCGFLERLKDQRREKNDPYFRITATEIDDTVSRIRALTPDPAAAVAGSAEPRVEFTDEFGSHHSMGLEYAAEELCKWINAWPGGLEEVESALKTARGIELNTAETLDWLKVKIMAMARSKVQISGQQFSHVDLDDVLGWIDDARRNFRVRTPAPPSPPQPNPVGRETEPVAEVRHSDGRGIPLVIWRDMYCPSPGTKLYTIPPAASAAFDEAAERKLFEAGHGGFEFDKHPDGRYSYPFVAALWRSWLASAKVQRGAVPAVVADVAQILRQWGDMANGKTVSLHKKELLGLAAKLGAAP